MTVAHLYRTVQDEESGELLLGAQVALCAPSTQTPISAPIYADEELTQQLPNPFTCDDGIIDVYVANPITVQVVTTYGTTVRLANYIPVLPPAENILTSPSPVNVTNLPGTGMTLTGVDTQNLEWQDPGVFYASTSDNQRGWFMGNQFALGNILRDTSGAVISASVTWPDGAQGAFVADVVSGDFPGRVDAWHVTWTGDAVGRTFFQPQVTRDSNGLLVDVPAPVIFDGIVNSMA